MLFIAKFVITYQPLSDSRKKESYQEIHNRLMYCARMCCAQIDYDYEIQHGYCDQFQELDLYRDVIYVYRNINHSHSYSSMAKLFEGCAEIAAMILDEQIEVSYPDNLPTLCVPPYDPDSGDDYPIPKFLK